MAYNHEYPYIDSQMFNDDWLINTVKSLLKEFANFVNLNTIKYADPIAWDITRQYESNTVVIDSRSGNAYISTKPVPAGIQIINTGFWTQIFNYERTINQLRSQIAINEGDTSTASRDIDKNSLVFVNGLLYKAMRDILAGDSFVIDSNIKKTTIAEEIAEEIENVFNELQPLIDEIFADMGSLSDLDTETKTSLVASINEVLADIGSLSDLNTENKSNIVAAVNELLTSINNFVIDLNTAINNTSKAINDKIIIVKNMQSLGLVNDGVTDNYPLFNTLSADFEDGDVLYFPKGTYYFSQPINIDKKLKIMGCGNTNYTDGDLYSVLKFNTSGITLDTHSIELCNIGITTVNGGDYGVKVLYAYCNIHDIFIYDKDYNNYFSSCIQYGDSSTDTWFQKLSNIQINPYIRDYETSTLHGNGVHVYSGVNCLFDNLFIQGKDIGIKFTNVENTHANDGINISNNVITWCNTGFNIVGSAIKISNSFIDQMKSYTIIMDDAINCDIINTWLGGNGENVIIRTSEQIHFSNCIICGNPRNTWCVTGANSTKIYFEYCTLQSADYGFSFGNSDVKEIGTIRREITNDDAGVKHLNETETFNYNIGDMGTSNTYTLQLPVATYGTPKNVLVSKGNPIWNVDYLWSVNSTNIEIVFYKTNGANFANDNGLFIITLEK